MGCKRCFPFHPPLFRFGWMRAVGSKVERSITQKGARRASTPAVRRKLGMCPVP